MDLPLSKVLSLNIVCNNVMNMLGDAVIDKLGIAA